MENSISRHAARIAAIVVGSLVAALALSPPAQHAIAMITAAAGAL